MLQACTADEYFGLGNEYNSLVTVVVPIYNTEKYLRRCLDSIINQSYSNLEIILIDDGSIDNSSKICYEYSINDHRIKIIRQKNAGVSVARNVGIRNATGQYITFVDSDDYIANDMVEILLHTIRKYNADISMCGMIRTSDKRNNMIDEDNSTVIYTQEEFVKVMLRITGNRIVHYPWGKLYKKEVDREIRATDFAPHFDDLCMAISMMNKSSSVGSLLGRFIPLALLVPGYQTGITQEDK